MTGASCNKMIIEVYGKDEKFVCRLDNNDALVGSYPIDDGARLHVTFFSVLFYILKSDGYVPGMLSPL